MKKKEISTATKKPIGCRLNISLILRILKVAIVSICLREGEGGEGYRGFGWFQIERALWFLQNVYLLETFFQLRLSDLQGEESFW